MDDVAQDHEHAISPETVTDLATRGLAATGSPERIGAGAYRALYLQCPDGVLFTVTDGRVIAANPAACDILLLSEDEICRRGRTGLADPSDERWVALVAERDRTGTARGVGRMLRGDGEAIEVEMSAQVFPEEGELRTCTVIRDVTERVAMERRMAEMGAELQDLAVLDELTGLRNRRGFLEVANQVLNLADREHLPCHVLFLDVDNMKDINDTFGHAVGDAALRTLAATLTQALRRSDVLARLGGDEFVALAVGLDERECVGLEGRIRRELASAQIAEDTTITVEVSLGWAVRLPGDASKIEDLLNEADRVMYADKKRRRTVGP